MKKTTRQIAVALAEASQNGLRPIAIICDNRKPMREFIVRNISEEDGGYVTGQEKGQRRMQVIKFREILDIR